MQHWMKPVTHTILKRFYRLPIVNNGIMRMKNPSIYSHNVCVIVYIEEHQA